MDFIHAECVGSKPDEIDETSSPGTVYVRRNFEELEETDDRPAGWAYEEAKLTRTEYALYKMEGRVGGLEDALVEVDMSGGDQIEELRDAVTELAGIVLGGE